MIDKRLVCGYFIVINCTVADSNCYLNGKEKMIKGQR